MAKKKRKTEEIPNVRMMSRQELIERYAPLIKLVATRMIRRLPPQVELDDLLHAGVVGLIDAAEKFDPDRDIKFETYAEFRIRGAILDELRSLDWVPRSLRQKFHELERAYDKLLKEYNRPPTQEEIARELQISEEEIEDLFAKACGSVLMSLDDMGYTNEDGHVTSPMEFLKRADEPDPIAVLSSKEVCQVLIKAIDELSERERMVISLYYFDGLTMKEMGELLGVTESRISQIHNKAIMHLRARLKEFLEAAM
ncbi:MAG TPA: FliA/WhiG family RNA polymerase sigma factor [Proteobacteria bacterium]|nr:FliA/WhiG family RNA polymerase sigma factor [Pseudomonadota bacterium]